MIGSVKSTLALVAVSATLMTIAIPTNDAKAQSVVGIKRECANGVCGESKYYGGKVRIYVSSKLSRTTHFNFKTNPGDQIEIRDSYSFDREPGDGGTYSVQACDRGGLGARSTCTKWATFKWSSGGQETEKEQ